VAEGSSPSSAHGAVMQLVDRSSVWRARSRWWVHLGLLSTAVASLATLQLLHVRVAYHSVVGLVFVGFVLVHLVQRRRTITRMATQFVRARTFVEREIRLIISDFILFFITATVLVSGILLWRRGAPVLLPFHLAGPLGRWRADSAVAPVIYLTVHVLRRRKRLRQSRIR
jgi:hypothetical protein